MKSERLDEIRARLAAARGGPWMPGAGDLLAHATTDIADLLAEVERLRTDAAGKVVPVRLLYRDIANTPDSHQSGPASPVGAPRQGGAGQDVLQGRAERLARCRAALERAWGFCADPLVPSRVVLAIRRAMQADSCYLGEEVDRAIAACKAAGLWEAAVNRPSQGVRRSPLANALQEARDALDKQG